jgi:hypothetical protein
MTPEQEQAIRERHDPATEGPMHHLCTWTVSDHDCDVGLAMKALDEARADRDVWREQWERDTDQVSRERDAARAEAERLRQGNTDLLRITAAERDAARADADALAVRFSTMSLAWHDQFHDDRRGTYEACKHVPCVSDRAALVAHEAKKEGA